MPNFNSFDPAEHEASTCISHFHTDSLLGLSQKEALERFKKFGPNKIEEEKKHPIRDFFLSQIKDPIILILLTVLALKIVTKEKTDAIAIGFVIVLNTSLGLFQNLKAQKALDALKSLMTRKARVVRDGEKKDIPAEDLVCGDIVFLESGMIIPSDARLLEVTNFSCDESMLTGESVPVEKNAKFLVTKKVIAAEKLNMVFSGTIVTKGRALACVTATGSNTELGKIANSLYGIDESKSPLQKRLEKFSKILSLTIMSLITVMVFIGILQGYNLMDLLLMAVGLVVSAIPEGLPLAITLCLVIGIQKMAEKKALVKKMPAVETLGSTNVICTDKTGTLTCNQMTLVKFAQGDDVFTVTGSGYEPVGHINGKGDFSKMALISSLVHETSLIKEEKGWVCHGDPTEGALITFARKLGLDFSQYHTKIVIPFESENRYMAAFVEDHQHKYLLIKGALDKVVHFCDKMLDQQGNVRPLDVKLLEAHQKAFSSEALRTLALCYIPLDKAYDGQKLQGGIFVALAGIEDPLRPDLEKMASACKTAGISIKMITGDHPHTARAIYHKLMGRSDYKILSGEQIDELTNDEKLETLPNVDIFARVSPQNKLDIVEALKAKKMIVAMTGDGVNDAPSLKGAHIGVAMGTGSDVAKEASSMILLDDNFASLVKAVEMGRMIFLTLQNLITYLLTTAASGVLTICFAIFLKFPLPILPIQFLWINLVTDGSSTLPMCFERLRPYLMLQKPKGQNEPLIGKTKAFYMAIISSYMMIGTLVAFYLSHFVIKHPLVYSQTIAFTTLALFQIWNVQNSRSFDEPILLSFSHKGKHLPRLPLKNNYPLLGTMLLALLLQIGSVFLTSLHPFLGTTHLELNHFGMIIVLTFSCVIVADFFKWMRFKKS